MNIPLRVKNLIKKYETCNPYELAKHLKIRIYVLDLPQCINGAYIRCLNRKVILINSNLPEALQKITLCHELGHARLHTTKLPRLMANGIYHSKTKMECEANQFALALLSHSTDIEASQTAYIHNLLNSTERNTQNTLLRSICSDNFNDYFCD